jgi:hypothetical protein
VKRKLVRRLGKMEERSSFASNLVWAVAFIVVVGMIMGALYYSGFLGGTKKEKIDINIKAPSTIIKIV